MSRAAGLNIRSGYQWINQRVRARLGGRHSARWSLHSVDFHEIDQLQGQDAWEALGPVLLDAAQVPWPAFDSMRLHAEAAAAQLWTNDVSRAVFVDEWIFGAA